MPLQPFEITPPLRGDSAVVIASPHSGRDYDPAFLRASVLDEVGIRSSEDAFVDLLVQSAPAHGMALICANAPRAYVDLNRAADEFDPALISGVPKGTLNPRVSSGLGVIPRVVANGRAIYRGKLTRLEAEQRITDIWHPYHGALHDLLEATRARHAQSILIDMHSMPHEAIASVTKAGTKPAQIVLGDRFGAACGGAIVDRVHAIFKDEGLRVARNAPFAGAWITQTYGRPSRNQHALQVEIDRAMYMDEHAVRQHGGFESFQKLMGRVTAKLAEIGRDHLALAAE